MRLLLPAQRSKIDWSLFNRQISTKACLVGYTVHQLLAFHTNGTKENELTYLRTHPSDECNVTLGYSYLHARWHKETMKYHTKKWWFTHKALTQNIMLNPNMKYLMQQLTS